MKFQCVNRMREILRDLYDYMHEMEIFDVKTPEDLYKLFMICHVFSWTVLFMKLK